MTQPLLILASASPARRQLLRSAGIEPIVCPSDLDESQVTLTNPTALVQTLAQLKAERIVQQLALGELALDKLTTALPTANETVLVLACDSVLALDGQIYGKPESPQAAIERWQRMRGQVGELYTGHALVETATRTMLVECAMTKVFFADIDDAQIAAYVATGEPLGCAGCFAIDGRGALFVEAIEGCHTNVIGLSLPLLRRMLATLGYVPQQFWSGLG